MTSKTYRPGINEAFVMNRHLRLEDFDAGAAERVVSSLDDIAGINSVAVDEEREMLDLSYDASQIGIRQIEKVIRPAGTRFSQDWMTRVKINWYGFTDSNIQSSARHQPGCCSKPPREP